MSDMEILKTKKPGVAEFIQRWKSKYEKSFDFSRTADQADFYESLVELSRHLATTASGANISLNISNEGVVGANLVVYQEISPPDIKDK